jgi:anti-sigma regulatory factor (Ser/Thr protein kinase)
MEARGSCHVRLENGDTNEVQSPRRPSLVPHPSRRLGAPAAIPPSHHGHDPDHWPLRNTLILEALADAVPSARAHLRQLLADWGWAELSPDVGVVVSELVTNSVAASAGLRLATASVLVWLGSDRHCLLLAVADASPRPPVRLNLRPDAEGGRGLALVEALSSRWGWHPVSTTGLTKVTWAEWRLPSGAGRRSATGVPSNRRCHLAEE